MIPFEIMALITSIWVLVGATLVMPYFSNRKRIKEGLTLDNIKKEVKSTIVEPLTKSLKTDIENFLPSTTEIEDSVCKNLDMKSKEILEKVTFDILKLQENIPAIFNNYVVSDQGQEVLQKTFQEAAKSVMGAIYGEMGVEEKAFKAGMQDAKQWITNAGNGQSPPQRQLRGILTDIVGPEMAENLDRKLGALMQLKQVAPELLGKLKGGGGGGGMPSGGNELAYY